MDELPGRPPTVGSLTLVLPAYNEEERLGPALDELFGYLRRRGGPPREGALESANLPDRIQVLVVDDGSSDGTAALVQSRPEAAAEVRAVGSAGPWRGAWLELLTVPHAGKGAAVKAGMLAGEGDAIIFTDADMATPPDQIPGLLLALETADVALGSRIQADGSDMRRTQPGFRRLLGKAFHALAAVWVTGPVRDTQCGFKGFSRDVARDLFAQQVISSIVFDVELIYLARRRNYRIAVVPIQWFDRRGSRMQTRPTLALRVAWDLFRIPFLHRRIGQRR